MSTPPEHAPAGVMVSELAEDLASDGHHVTVITGWPNHPAGVLYAGWRARWRSVEHDPRAFSVICCAHSIHPRERFSWRHWSDLTFAFSTLIEGWRSEPFDVLLCLSTPVVGSWTATKCSFVWKTLQSRHTLSGAVRPLRPQRHYAARLIP
jgi:putative colanic acid biosynthesis glycosyltransferase WcaI